MVHFFWLTQFTQYSIIYTALIHITKDTIMATEQEKQELVDILKFEPIPVRVFITGRGGESYASVVDRKVYEYFKGRKLDIEQYADDYDNEYEVPKELQPFEPGSPYDCDNLWHVSGASIDDAVISIKNAITGELIWSCFADFASLVTAEVNINEEIGRAHV